METPSSTRLRLAAAADVLLLLVLSFAASVAISGGFRTAIGGTRIAVTSVGWVLVCAGALFLLRHAILLRPSVFERIAVAARTNRRAFATWFIVAIVGSIAGLVASTAIGIAPGPGDDEGWSQERIRQVLFEELRPTRLVNCTYQRFGEPNDGGYLMCKNLLGDVKAGYSYGIAGYDGWGCDVSRRAGVRVHEYDCFDPRHPACAGGDTMFHEECIAGSRSIEEGRLFDTFMAQMARNGDAGKHVVMKVDVEGAEWETFRQTPDEVFERVDQMSVEFHGLRLKLSIDVIQRLKKFFYVAHVHYNNFTCRPRIEPFPAWAYEVLFVNKRLGQVGMADSQYFGRVWKALGLVRPEPPNPLDAPNNPGAPDCQAK